MKEKPIHYEPHPVSPERKAELVASGVRIIDAIYKPKDEPKADEKGEIKAGPAMHHKGRGKYDVVDASGTVIATGLTKEEAQQRLG